LSERIVELAGEWTSLEYLLAGWTHSNKKLFDAGRAVLDEVVARLNFIC